MSSSIARKGGWVASGRHQRLDKTLIASLTSVGSTTGLLEKDHTYPTIMSTFWPTEPDIIHPHQKADHFLIVDSWPLAARQSRAAPGVSQHRSDSRQVLRRALDQDQCILFYGTPRLG